MNRYFLSAYQHYLVQRASLHLCILCNMHKMYTI